MKKWMSDSVRLFYIIPSHFLLLRLAVLPEDNMWFRFEQFLHGYSWKVTPSAWLGDRLTSKFMSAKQRPTYTSDADVLLCSLVFLFVFLTEFKMDASLNNQINCFFSNHCFYFYKEGKSLTKICHFDDLNVFQYFFFISSSSD